MKSWNIRPVLTTAALVGTLLAGAGQAYASPVDLSTWTALTLNYPGNQGPGNWVLQPGNTEVRQIINADPSFFLNGLTQTSYTVQGTLQVIPDGDDDFIGFVFGYQNSSNFYLFDWKASAQSNGGGVAAEGMTLKKYQGATGDGLVDLSIGEFWENVANRGDMTVLATNHATTAGWVGNQSYYFLLDYGLVPGQIHVRITQGGPAGTLLWDTTVSDGTFGAGQFGFYNNSQAVVRYAGFELDVIPTDPAAVPEPATLTLLGAGLALTALRMRRGRRA